MGQFSATKQLCTQLSMTFSGNLMHQNHVILKNLIPQVLKEARVLGCLQTLKQMHLTGKSSMLV